MSQKVTYLLFKGAGPEISQRELSSTSGTIEADFEGDDSVLASCRTGCHDSDDDDMVEA
jgi:hypothetical protein